MGRRKLEGIRKVKLAASPAPTKQHLLIRENKDIIVAWCSQYLRSNTKAKFNKNIETVDCIQCLKFYAIQQKKNEKYRLQKLAEGRTHGRDTDEGEWDD